MIVRINKSLAGIKSVYALEYQNCLSKRGVLQTWFFWADVFCGLARFCIGCKHVQVIFIDIREAKFRTLSLLVRPQVRDGIRTLQEAPRSLCVSFHVCNCVHSNYSSYRGYVFSTPSFLPAATLLLVPSPLWLLYGIYVNISESGRQVY